MTKYDFMFKLAVIKTALVVADHYKSITIKFGIHEYSTIANSGHVGIQLMDSLTHKTNYVEKEAN